MIERKSLALETCNHSGSGCKMLTVAIATDCVLLHHGNKGCESYECNIPPRGQIHSYYRKRVIENGVTGKDEHFAKGNNESA